MSDQGGSGGGCLGWLLLLAAIGGLAYILMGVVKSDARQVAGLQGQWTLEAGQGQRPSIWANGDGQAAALPPAARPVATAPEPQAVDLVAPENLPAAEVDRAPVADLGPTAAPVVVYVDRPDPTAAVVYIDRTPAQASPWQVLGWVLVTLVSIGGMGGLGLLFYRNLVLIRRQAAYTGMHQDAPENAETGSDDKQGETRPELDPAQPDKQAEAGETEAAAAADPDPAPVDVLDYLAGKS